MAIKQLPFLLNYGNGMLTIVFVSSKGNAVQSSRNILNAVEHHISFTIKKKIITRSLFWTPVSHKGNGHNVLIIDVYRGPPIPIDIWISSPTMTNDTRSVQLRLHNIMQLVS